MTDAAVANRGDAPEVSVTLAPAPESPWRVFWRQFRKSPLAVAGAITLAFLYMAALLAQFIAPYPQEMMDRQDFYHPPMRIHWIDQSKFHAIPFVYATTLADPARFRYQEDRSRPMPLRFLVRGTPYRFLGLIPTRRHLYGVDPPGTVHLLGTDNEGR